MSAGVVLTPSRVPPVASRTAQVGMWLAIACISMLFLSFTSAFVVRHGLDPGWQTMRMPRILPANTLALIASSVFLEIARRSLRRRAWLWATLGAGLVFVAGQFATWVQLRDSGLFFASSAHLSFFYTITVSHGVHLAGGLLALGWVALSPPSRARRWFDATALYWHYMGALWLFLVFVLFGLK